MDWRGGGYFSGAGTDVCNRSFLKGERHFKGLFLEMNDNQY